MSQTARRFVLFILLLGMAGTTTELMLLEHDEDLNQWIPLVVLGAGFVSLGWLAVLPGSAAVSVVRIVAACFILSGIVGVVLHYQANLEFQREVDPSLTGWALWQKAIRAKSPPGLAPGVMVQLGLLSLVYTFRHPGALTGGQALSSNETEGQALSSDVTGARPRRSET
ncbi:MAG: hypothetical protein ACRD2N_23520 [Vicinamibacterales bacterium]